MTGFFRNGKLRLINGSTSFTAQLVIVPVEDYPDLTATTMSQLTGLVMNTSSAVQSRMLQDVGNNSNNRIFIDGNASKMRFQPVDWGALQTLTGDDIVGFVIYDHWTSNYSSGGASRPPIFYIDRVDLNTGLPEPFTPDGINELTINLSTGVMLSEFGGKVFDNFRYQNMRGWTSIQGNWFYAFLTTEEPDNEDLYVNDLQGLVTSSSSPVNVQLVDINNENSNRVYLDGNMVKIRFQNALFANLTTDQNDPVTHVVIADGNNTSSNLCWWNELAEPLTADGVKSIRVVGDDGEFLKI